MTAHTVDQSQGPLKPIPPDYPEDFPYAGENRPKQASFGKLPLVIVVLVIVVLVIVVGIFAFIGGNSYGVNREDSRTDKEALEVERQTAERELEAYAKANDLPVTDIDAFYENGVLYASWVQGNQSCTVKAIPPSKQNQLWSAAPVKEGSGQCLTKSGSSGINTGG